MNVVDVDAGNLAIYLNLVQAYEAEFSPLTGKKPGSDGRFALDTHLGGNVRGYLLYLGETPAGLAAIESERGEHEVREFTQERFEEDHHDDPMWGRVVRQRFVVGN